MVTISTINKLIIVAILAIISQIGFGQSVLTTEKLIITDGATNGFILRSNAAGNATWVNPSTLLTGGSTDWGTNGANIYNLNTGNVGIGTTTPIAKLEVNGIIRSGIIQTNDTKIDINRLGSGDRNALLDFWTNDGSPAQDARIFRGQGLNGNFSMQNEGTGDIFFRLNNGNRVFMKANGNVGIGVPDPAAKLEVDGAIISGNIQTNSTRIEINEFGTGDRSAILDFHGSDEETDFSARLWRLPGEDGHFRIENRGLGNMIFRTQNINRAIINPAGKFVIGPQTTATPGNYNLYVENGILTERVKIATIGTADWADYVFEEDYKLHTLEEVKSFVQEHKHLPNVPSAKDVHEKGYELQLMDAKLLEKIEELYLLTIELNEEKNEMKEQNELLKKSILKMNQEYEILLKQLSSRISKIEKANHQ